VPISKSIGPEEVVEGLESSLVVLCARILVTLYHFRLDLRSKVLCRIVIIMYCHDNLETDLESIMRQVFQRFVEHRAVIFPSDDKAYRVLDVIRWWKEASGCIIRVRRIKFEKKSREKV
jgi:hypothetical protein